MQKLLQKCRGKRENLLFGNNQIQLTRNFVRPTFSALIETFSATMTDVVTNCYRNPKAVDFAQSKL